LWPGKAPPVTSLAAQPHPAAVSAFTTTGTNPIQSRSASPDGNRSPKTQGVALLEGAEHITRAGDRAALGLSDFVVVRAAAIGLVLCAAAGSALALAAPARADFWGCHVGRSVAGLEMSGSARFDGVRATVTVLRPVSGVHKAAEHVAGVVGLGPDSNYLSVMVTATRSGRRLFPVISWNNRFGAQSLRLVGVNWDVGTAHVFVVRRDRASSPRAGGRRWRVVIDRRYVNWVPLDPRPAGLTLPRVFMSAQNAETPCDVRTSMRFTDVRVRRVGEKEWVPFLAGAQRGMGNHAYDLARTGPSSFVVSPGPLAGYSWTGFYSTWIALGVAMSAALVLFWTRRSYVRDLRLTLRMLAALVLLVLLYLPLFAVFPAWVYGRTSSLLPMLVACVVEVALATRIPFLSAQVLLRRVGARFTNRTEVPELHSCVEMLCGLANLPKPQVAVLEGNVSAAFAVGSGRTATIVVSTGLLERLEPRELEAVVAHELAHIANGDALASTVLSLPALLSGMLLKLPMRWFGTGAGTVAAYVAAGVAFGLWPGLMGLWLLWVLSTLLVLTISRHREFVADRSAALLTGAPAALMSALTRIGGAAHEIPAADLRDLEGIDAFLIVPIDEPETGWTFDPNRIFPTHPPIEKRLARLAHLARRGDDLSSGKAQKPIAARAKRPSNRTATIVLVAGLCASQIEAFPGWPHFAQKAYPAWAHFGHNARMLMLAATIPVLLVAFRALGRALNGAPGAARSAIGTALWLQHAFWFFAGLVSSVFVTLLQWH
jgi:heat shock protein HtpX